MKGETKELKITEITWDEFQKLNLTGYRYVKKYYRKSDDSVIEYDEEIENIVSTKDFYSKTVWEKVDLNKIVLSEIEFSKKQEYTNPICLAIHDPVTSEDIKDMTTHVLNSKNALDMCLFQKSYLDKYLTWRGPQTYLIRCDVKHLYSKRNHFYTTDDYFDVPKMCTKAVYLIKF